MNMVGYDDEMGVYFYMYSWCSTNYAKHRHKMKRNVMNSGTETETHMLHIYWI